ncbi:MAG: DNA replication protein [Candidatus Marinimicrobia bacterium]|nr:DNA replication protein [Candidatus Neomarinimicrobiota bacterium]RPG05204.1 MAG: DNA replication protein [Pelagibacteraceae bacterium TMED247]
MSEQLIFNFPFKRSYLSQDFYVSENNINAYKLIESWPNWSSRFVNIFGPKGCGKTHLINILKDKIENVLISSSKVDSKILLKYKVKECLIIDDFKNEIDEKLLYTITNMGFQDNKYLIISSLIPLKKFNVKLNDLSSRFSSFLEIGIDLPTDELLRVILTKNFSDKQIEITKKNIEYILKNIDRSYEKVNLFTNSVDNLSLAKAQPIKLNLIKKVLKDLKF